tara:strand:- start:1136 stop:1477 length:342 start_codon:yes stop_codon:yes gene_type:complete
LGVLELLLVELESEFEVELVLSSSVGVPDVPGVESEGEYGEGGSGVEKLGLNEKDGEIDGGDPGFGPPPPPPSIPPMLIGWFALNVGGLNTMSLRCSSSGANSFCPNPPSSSL